MTTKHWLHPAASFIILENGMKDDSPIKIYTDGSKTEQGVVAGAAIYTNAIHTMSLKYRLYNKCTTNQAEQLAILKALEYTNNLNTTRRLRYTLTAK
jgi:ribonuclease HI